MPNLRTSEGDTGDTNPNAISGNVVKMPAIADASPVWRVTTSTRGPTPVIAGRRFADNSTMPQINIPELERGLDGEMA